MNDDAKTSQTEKKEIYPTLTGLPLSFDLRWPFHKSTSGADFWVLRADIRLEGSGGLHAPVSVNLSQTVYDVIPSLEPKDARVLVINALRKEVDQRQLEFVRSGKLVPVHFSSRDYDFKRQKWVFGRASEEEVEKLVERKVYWQTKLAGGTVWVGDPAEALYVDRSVEQVLAKARELAQRGLMTLEGEHASANSALMAQAERFEAEMRAAMAQLEKKHAFERG